MATIAVSGYRLLGGGYSFAPALAVEIDDGAVQIVARSRSAGSVLVPTVFLAALFALLVGLLRWSVGPNLWDAFPPALIAAIGILAAVGPPIAMLAMQENLASLNPLVECSLQTNEVSILAERKAFGRDAIHSLVGVALRDTDGEVKCELQLIERVGEGILDHRVVGSPSSDATKAFAEVLAEFRAATGISAAVVQATGISGRGGVAVQEIP